MILIENELSLENKIECLPKTIKDKINELKLLVQEHPNKIPTVKVAKFLGMDIECLRRGIEQGTIPFALGCNNDKFGNRYTYISAPTFYLWYLSPMIK